MGELRPRSYTIRCRYSKLYSANRPAGLWPVGQFLSFHAARKFFFDFFSAESGFARKTCAVERSVSGKGKYHSPSPSERGWEDGTQPPRLWRTVQVWRLLQDCIEACGLGLASTLDFFAQGATVQALFVLVYSHITSMLFYISGTDIRTKHQFIF